MSDLPPLNEHQRRMIRALRDFLGGHPQFTRYERVVQNERGEVRIEYVSCGGPQEYQQAIQVFPAGPEEFQVRSQGSRSVWKPSALREVPDAEL